MAFPQCVFNNLPLKRTYPEDVRVEEDNEAQRYRYKEYCKDGAVGQPPARVSTTWARWSLLEGIWRLDIYN